MRHHHALLGLVGQHSQARPQGLALRAVLLGLHHRRAVADLVLGLTLGSSGSEGRPFVADLSQASSGSIRSALIGGAIFNLANILLVAAIEIAGMAVAFPVGIGLALIIGVVVNYLADPVGNVSACWCRCAARDRGDHSGCGCLSAPGRRAAGVSTKGLVLSVACGMFMGMFYRFVAAAMYGDGVTRSRARWARTRRCSCSRSAFSSATSCGTPW